MAIESQAASPTTRGTRLAGRVARLASKELRETLRDRRTILTLVLMPLLLYPLLTLGFQKFILSTKPAAAGHGYFIGVSSLKQKNTLEFLLQYGAVAMEDEARLGGQKPADIKYDIVILEDIEGSISRGELDLGVKLIPVARDDDNPKAPDQAITKEHGLALDCHFIYEAGTMGPLVQLLERRLQAAAAAWLADTLRKAGIAQRSRPFQFQRLELENPNLDKGMSLAGMIPVVLILMTITGAVYPAIDLTAGERERNTLEILIAAPVPRLGLLFAKYVAVVTVALLTATINLVSMVVTLQVSGMGAAVWGEGMPVVAMIEVLLLLVLFAAFFSAVLLGITSFARSFKEAQAYLIPLMLLSISPGLVSLMPGIKLEGWLAAMPLLNVTLLARDLLASQATFSTALVVICTTALYGAAALGIASQIFGADAVLYDARSTWADLVRPPRHPQPAASISSALLCLALLFPATFVVSHLVLTLKDLGIGAKLLANSMAAGCLFGGVPWLLARQQRVDWCTGLQWRPAPLVAYPAAVLLGLSLWPFAHELVVFTMRCGLVTLSPEMIKKGQTIVDQLRTTNVVGILLAMAVVPAVTEEWLFRGYVFSAFRQRTSPWASIVASGVLFGLFHLLSTDFLAIERLAPSTALGIVLGWVCWRTGSVRPGMLLHACHNGVLLLLAFYSPQLQSGNWLPEGFDEPGATVHLPLNWLAAAAVGVATGGLILSLQTAPELGPPDGRPEFAVLPRATGWWQGVLRSLVPWILALYWLLIFTATHLPKVPEAIDLSKVSDKTLHYGAYGGLGFLLALWLASSKRLNSRSGRVWGGVFGAALLMTVMAAYGAFDELTQTLVGRHCDLLDWYADMLGGLSGIVVFTLVSFIAGQVFGPTEDPLKPVAETVR